jgi:hypothetical protein
MARGERVANAKLTDADVVMIRALYASGWLLRDLAPKFGVSVATLPLIINRKTWKTHRGALFGEPPWRIAPMTAASRSRQFPSLPEFISATMPTRTHSRIMISGHVMGRRHIGSNWSTWKCGGVFCP